MKRQLSRFLLWCGVCGSAILLALCVIDIVLFGSNYFIGIFVGYGVVAILLSFLVVSLSLIPNKNTLNLTKFQKALRGGLYHFCCCRCGGMFAVKRSRYNDRRSFFLLCPICGRKGRTIVGNAFFSVNSIPVEKSSPVRFACRSCGEYVSLWVEGSAPFEDSRLLSCPYCGEFDSMMLI